MDPITSSTASRVASPRPDAGAAAPVAHIKIGPYYTARIIDDTVKVTRDALDLHLDLSLPTTDSSHKVDSYA